MMKYIQYILMILAYFFNPEIRKKKEIQKDFKRLKDLEKEYRQALADGDPQKAGEIDKQMREIRAEYKLTKLNNKGM